MIEKNIDRFPFKKMLYLQWYEAAIANIILFKYMKQKQGHHIYFLISQQGVMLKATSINYLKNTQQQINCFFQAKIQQLEVSASSDFYDNIINDIQGQTERLKDSRDCPYINLVYSQKIKNSCLAMKKFGYSKPYQQWQITERQKRGFCYLIVRPEHRWKQIANIVLNLIKKRQGYQPQKSASTLWTLQLSYQKFLWLHRRRQYKNIQDNIQVKQKTAENKIIIAYNKQSSELFTFQQTIKKLNHRYYDQKIYFTQKQLADSLLLSALDIERLTEIIYHSFGLTNLVKSVRGKNNKFLIIGPSQEIGDYPTIQSKNTRQNFKNNQLNNNRFNMRQDITKLTENQINSIISLSKLGKRHELIKFSGLDYVIIKFQLPLKNYIIQMLKLRIPSLPRYFYYFTKNNQLFLLRKFQTKKLKSALFSESLSRQIFLMNSLLMINIQLQKRNICVGPNISDYIFVDGLRIIVEPVQGGNKQEDHTKIVLFCREWLNGLQNSQLKQALQKINNPIDMLPIFDNYLSQHPI